MHGTVFKFKEDINTVIYKSGNKYLLFMLTCGFHCDCFCCSMWYVTLTVVLSPTHK